MGILGRKSIQEIGGEPSAIKVEGRRKSSLGLLLTPVQIHYAGTYRLLKYPVFITVFSFILLELCLYIVVRWCVRTWESVWRYLYIPTGRRKEQD